MTHLAKDGTRRGRKRTVTPDTYTPEQLKQIDDMAEAQCKDQTIAHVLGVDEETFKREFRRRTHQKRDEGKAKVLQAQYKGALAHGKGAVTERIWFGKQHLEQTDKANVEHGGLNTFLEFLIGRNGRDNPADDTGKVEP